MYEFMRIFIAAMSKIISRLLDLAFVWFCVNTTAMKTHHEKKLSRNVYCAIFTLVLNISLIRLLKY